MVKPSPAVLESLARIKFGEPAFVEWLEEELADHHRNLVTQTEEVQVRILQGHAQNLTKILKAIESASELLRKA